jgi:hypothetical protein
MARLMDDISTNACREINMSIILEHLISKKRCILLGPASGIDESAPPDPWLGGIKAIVKSASSRLLVVADEEGKIDWVNSKDYKVVCVSGLSPRDNIQATFDNKSLG